MVFGLTTGVLIYEDLKNFRNYVCLTTTGFQTMRNFFTFHLYYILKVNYQKVPDVKIIGTFLQKCCIGTFLQLYLYRQKRKL